MANLKDIVATLAILSAGTLTLTGCKKEGETANPDEVKAGDTGEAPPAEGEGSCKGEGSCEGEKAEGGEKSRPKAAAGKKRQLKKPRSLNQNFGGQADSPAVAKRPRRSSSRSVPETQCREHS
jgi:hypothetical protein